MASTRCNKPKRKSLRLTDFFASIEEREPDPLQGTTAEASTPLPTPRLSASTQHHHTIQATNTMRQKSSQPPLPSGKPSTLKRGAAAHATAREKIPPPAVDAAGSSLLPNASASSSPAKKRLRMEDDAVAQSCSL